MKGAAPPTDTAPIAGLVIPFPTAIDAPASTVTFPLTVRLSFVVATSLLILNAPFLIYKFPFKVRLLN